MIVCTYEDRPDAVVGLKLLVLSLGRHCPGLKVHVFCPVLDSPLRDWFASQSNVAHLHDQPLTTSGWSVKPDILLDRLDAGFAEVVWIDADVIATRDPLPLLRPGSPDTLVTTAEHRIATQPPGSRIRTRGLGLHVGRDLPVTVNASVVCATARHRDLLTRWRDIMHDRPYRDAQASGFPDRPTHFQGDQDVLTGLLGAAEFAEIPLRLLRPGDDIAHCLLNSGYTVLERLRNLGRGLPPLVHAQGPKPWQNPGRLTSRLSPYSAAARPYAADLGEPADWVRPAGPLAAACHAATLGSPNLRDLPFAALKELRIRAAPRGRLRRLLRRG